MAYHIHTIRVLTRDDPEGESISEVMRANSNQVLDDSIKSNIETWEFTGKRTAIPSIADLDYDTDLCALEQSVPPSARYTIKQNDKHKHATMHFVYDEVMQLEVFHWWGETGPDKCAAVADALNALGHKD